MSEQREGPDQKDEDDHGERGKNKEQSKSGGQDTGKKQDNDNDNDEDKDKDKDKSRDQGGKDSKADAGKKKQRNYLVMAIFGAVLVLIGIGILIYHLTIGRYYVDTKDAYVMGDLVRLAPQVSGTVTQIATEETQPVFRGQLLIRLDPHDTAVSLAQAEANLALTARDVVQLFDERNRDAAAVAAQEAQLTLSGQNLNRDLGLIKAHGVALQDLERDQEARRGAQASLREARASLAATEASIAGTEPRTHPRVLQAEANMRSAWLASNRTRVLSPISGYVVRRSVQLGEQVNPATDLLAIAPLDSVWINANFKETDLEKIRIGQPVRVIADIYGSAFKYHGRVLGLTGGTGSALAVLPAENATGNWIKIVQRLAVRIGLDADELRQHPLFLGLSTSVEIDVHDIRGTSLAPHPVWPANLQTDVYAGQDAGVDEEIHRILDRNLKGEQTTLTTVRAAQ